MHDPFSEYQSCAAEEGDQNREEMLVERARRLMSECNWSVGQCASDWTQKYASGRTDADFGALVGLSGDQVYQRRRVWDRFEEYYSTRMLLSWSHYYAALTWDDAEACLAWAEEANASVKEMQAWRRLQRGELHSQPEPTETVALEAAIPNPKPVKGSYWPPEVLEAARAMADEMSEQTVAQPVAELPAPVSVRPTETAPAARTEPDDRAAIERMTAALSRVLECLTATKQRHFRDVPKEVRIKFLTLAEKIGQLARNLS